MEMLRSADLRVTQPRLAVLAAVRAHPHADTDAIFGAVRKQLGVEFKAHGVKAA